MTDPAPVLPDLLVGWQKVADRYNMPIYVFQTGDTFHAVSNEAQGVGHPGRNAQLGTMLEGRRLPIDEVEKLAHLVAMPACRCALFGSRESGARGYGRNGVLADSQRLGELRRQRTRRRASPGVGQPSFFIRYQTAAPCSRPRRLRAPSTTWHRASRRAVRCGQLAGAGQ
jgi:hypothetical protein